MDLPIKFLATAIGSFPQKNANDSLDIIFENIPDAPVWPQLSKLGLHEQMEIQYSEGIPRVVIDEVKERMFIDTTGDYSEDLANFYETYLSVMESDGEETDLSKMAITSKHSKGIYAFYERLKSLKHRPSFVKLHTTGPVSFGLSVVDENKRAIFYNEEFRDVIVKAMALKCKWQIQKFKSLGQKVICFIDEPILSAFGSSTYLSVGRDEIISIIKEMVEAIHQDGAICGIHCCGNTDWSIPIQGGIDLLNFDAYEYGKTVALYPKDVSDFVNRGGKLAFGVVPTSDIILKQTITSLLDHYEDLVQHLSEKTGIDKQLIYDSTILTPSCGTGTLKESTSEKVFELLKDLSLKLRTLH